MKSYVFLFLASLSLGACAQNPQAQPAGDAANTATPAATPAPATPTARPGTPEAIAEAALRELQPGLRIERIGAAPLPGGKLRGVLEGDERQVRRTPGPHGRARRRT